MNTHNLICDFGKHKGLLYTRLPVQYLKWMVQSNHSKADIAKAELERRGTVTPTVEVSGHAIDRASLNCRKIWHETAKDENEGLHAWLCRMCEEALSEFKLDEENRIFYKGMKLVFEPGEWPILKTIMPCRNKSQESPSMARSLANNSQSPKAAKPAFGRLSERCTTYEIKKNLLFLIIGLLIIILFGIFKLDDNYNSLLFLCGYYSNEIIRWFLSNGRTTDNSN